jgi:hypothetical protein
MFMVAVPLDEELTGGAPGAEMTLEDETGALAWGGVVVGAGDPTVLTLSSTLWQKRSITLWS